MSEKFSIPIGDEKRFEVPIGDPRGIDPHTGRSPAEIKLTQLEKEDRKIESLGEDDIEDYLTGLQETLQMKPGDPDTLNKIARLRARLDKMSQENTH